MAYHLPLDSQSEGQEPSIQAALVEYTVGDSGGTPEGCIRGSIMEGVQYVPCDCIKHVNPRARPYHNQARHHHYRAKHSFREAKRPAKGTGGRIDGTHAAATLCITNNGLATRRVDCPTVPGSY